MRFLRGLFSGGNARKYRLFTPPAPPSDDAIALAEAALKIKFPASFLVFIRSSRPVSVPQSGEFYWIGEENLGPVNIITANRREREESGVPLPFFLVAFYNDGMGNQLCFDTRHRPDVDEYSIVFWDHELSEQENLAESCKVSKSGESAGVVAVSFADWLSVTIQSKV